MKAWIVYNGFLPGESFFDFANMLQDAATNIGHEAITVRNDHIVNLLTHNRQDYFKEALPDYVVFSDKDIYLAKQIELLGVPVFNSAETIEISDDKIKTYQYVSKQQLPIPKTIVAPKTFGIHSTLSDSFIDEVIEELGFPLVMKEAFGSFGEQVYLIHHRRELENYIEKLSNVPYLFQQFIETSYGKDIRLQVVGDQVVCGMLRQSEDDFRANVTNGAKMLPYEPNHKEIQIAVAASKAIDADFSGVDLLFGTHNEPVVCEVNSNAHIRNLLECTGINAATDIIAYIEQQLKEKPKT